MIADYTSARTKETVTAAAIVMSAGLGGYRHH